MLFGAASLHLCIKYRHMDSLHSQVHNCIIRTVPLNIN